MSSRGMAHDGVARLRPKACGEVDSESPPVVACRSAVAAQQELCPPRSADKHCCGPHRFASPRVQFLPPGVEFGELPVQRVQA